ncbi:flavin reductase [Nocardia testacea]|uniref:flavin reductase n=1 Tax=Nocardia testacea TaxID=248551 RepID=UPI003C2E127F
MVVPDIFTEYPLPKVDRPVEPEPAIMISTSDGGRPDLMTNGFNMPVRHGGLIGFVLGPWNHSFDILRETGECVIAIPSAELAQQLVDLGNTTTACGSCRPSTPGSTSRNEAPARSTTAVTEHSPRTAPRSTCATG